MRTIDHEIGAAKREPELSVDTHWQRECAQMRYHFVAIKRDLIKAVPATPPWIGFILPLMSALEIASALFAEERRECDRDRRHEPEFRQSSHNGSPAGKLSQKASNARSMATRSVPSNVIFVS